MRPMRVPVLRVLCGQCFVADDQHVFRVLFLRRLREIERPRDDNLAVDDHHLVMGDGVGGVDLCRYPLVGEEVGGGVFLRALALVEDDLDLDASCVGIKQRLGNRRRGEAVGLDENARLGSSNGVDNQLSAVRPRGEANGRAAGGRRLR